MTQTAAGIVVGTAAYMSPEQAEAKPLDARSDIFSFGAVLYEMCSGKRAFQGDSNASVLADVLREEPRPLRDLREDLPAELTRLVMRCLRKDPARRVQSMADLKVAFDELKDEIDSGKTAVAPAAPRAVSRWSWPSAAAGAVISAAIVSAVFLLGSPQRTVTADDAPMAPLPLTTYPGREVFAVLSPDGNSVAFTWNGEHQDNFDIYVQLIGAGSPLRLTTDPLPHWSGGVIAGWPLPGVCPPHRTRARRGDAGTCTRWCRAQAGGVLGALAIRQSNGRSAVDARWQVPVREWRPQPRRCRRHQST